MLTGYQKSISGIQNSHHSAHKKSVKHFSIMTIFFWKSAPFLLLLEIGPIHTDIQKI